MEFRRLGRQLLEVQRLARAARELGDKRRLGRDSSSRCQLIIDSRQFLFSSPADRRRFPPW